MKIVTEIQVETTILLVVVVDLNVFNLSPKRQVPDMNIMSLLVFSLFVGICEECKPEILSMILALDLIMAEEFFLIDLIRNILRCPFYGVHVILIIVWLNYVFVQHPMRILAYFSVHFCDDGSVASLGNVIYRVSFVKEVISDFFSFRFIIKEELCMCALRL
jgi:hypothetical protein